MCCIIRKWLALCSCRNDVALVSLGYVGHRGRLEWTHAMDMSSFLESKSLHGSEIPFVEDYDVPKHKKFKRTAFRLVRIAEPAMTGLDNN